MSDDPGHSIRICEHVAWAIALLLSVAAGTAWSSWPLLAAAVCLLSGWSWRVTRL